MAVFQKPPLIVADTITPREIVWLWYPYIPSFATTLIFGPGGHGKSHITVDIAARLSTGAPLPGQLEGGKPQKILMLSAEDDFETVLVPRLIKAGADRSKIAFPKTPFTLDKAGIKAVEEYMHEFGATIVFIDPIVQYMGGKVDMNKANEVRSFMGELQQLAMRKQTAVIIVGHSRKSRSDDSSPDFERAMGSADFNNSVRSAMYVTKGSDGTRLFKHVKQNNSPPGPTLAFDFNDGVFSWLGEIDDEEGHVVPVRAQKKAKQDKWLKDLLRAGPVLAKEVESAARAFGMSKRTLDRVKQGIATSRMRYENGTPVWYWELLEGETSNVEEVSVSVQGLEDTGRGQERIGSSTTRTAGGRRKGSRGSKVEPGARVGDRGAVRKVAGRRSEGRAEDVLGSEPAEGGVGGVISNRERARQLLKAMEAESAGHA